MANEAEFTQTARLKVAERILTLLGAHPHNIETVFNKPKDLAVPWEQALKLPPHNILIAINECVTPFYIEDVQKGAPEKHFLNFICPTIGLLIRIHHDPHITVTAYSHNGFKFARKSGVILHPNQAQRSISGTIFTLKSREILRILMTTQAKNQLMAAA